MLEVPTTSNENSIDDESNATRELPEQTSTRENDFKKSEKSDSETLSYRSRSSKNNQQSYEQYDWQYLDYYTRYASTYALYDRQGEIFFYYRKKFSTPKI